MPTPTPLPRCEPGELQAPIDLSPTGETAIVDPTVMLYLNWGYPSTDCAPDFFEAFVWTGVEPATPGATVIVNFDSAPIPGPWSAPWPFLPLESGNTYDWWIHAGLETGPGPDVDGPNAHGYFFTGPVCTNETMLSVNLQSPADGTVINDLTADVFFYWDDPTPCLVNGLFELQISDDPTFATYLHRIPILQSRYPIPGDEIPLEHCTTYYWRVKTDPNGPPEEPFSEIWSFRAVLPETDCPPDASSPAPMAIAKLDLNCRSGPGPAYEIYDAFMEGISAPIEGRNQANDWFYILSPNRGIRCWVWGEQVDVEGDTSRLPVVDAEPPSTEEPTTGPAQAVNCAQYTDVYSCSAIPACRWDRYQTTTGGQCVNR
ncbi:MAG: hypothetical protein ABIJ39_07650 [Chloroflexota bacterium]